MKPLIATACICIIGLTGWVAVNAYADHRNAQRYAVVAKCSPVWDSEPYEIEGKSMSELRIRKALVEECTDYLRTGY